MLFIRYYEIASFENHRINEHSLCIAFYAGTGLTRLWDKECAPIFDKYNLSDEMLLKNNVAGIENEIIDFLNKNPRMQHSNRQ